MNNVSTFNPSIYGDTKPWDSEPEPIEPFVSHGESKSIASSLGSSLGSAASYGAQAGKNLAKAGKYGGKKLAKYGAQTGKYGGKKIASAHHYMYNKLITPNYLLLFLVLLGIAIAVLTEENRKGAQSCTTLSAADKLLVSRCFSGLSAVSSLLITVPIMYMFLQSKCGPIQCKLSNPELPLFSLLGVLALVLVSLSATLMIKCKAAKYSMYTLFIGILVGIMSASPLVKHFKHK